jgi:hypothetical protein
MPIHEKSLIRPENLKTHDELVIDGVDVSGHWSTFIEARVVTDYNEALEEEIAALPGAPLLAVRLVHEFLHRERDQPGLQSALLDLPDPRGHGIRTAARQGHHLAVRLLQQVHLCLPA